MISKLIKTKSTSITILPLVNSFSTFESSNQVRNMNLKFDTPEWAITLYPNYPQIYKKKGKNLYEVSNNSLVLAFIFLNKTLQNSQAWQKKKWIGFRFKELGLMLTAKPLSGQQIQVQTGRSVAEKEKYKILKLKDMPNESQVEISLSTLILDSSSNSNAAKQPKKDIKWDIKTTMSYSEYRIMYKLLENSLLDLSGWKLMMDLQKQYYMTKITGKASEQKSMDEFFDK